MNRKNESTIGIIGMGLMGSSIATALLIHDETVIALAPIKSDIDSNAPNRIRQSLTECYEEGLSDITPEELMQRIIFTDDYEQLKDCWLVMECIIEKIEIKRSIYDRIEDIVSEDAIVVSNTSALPISILQDQVRVPERFFGMHWAEPAFTSRFMEIICGKKSDKDLAEKLYNVAKQWGKEPTLIKKDIRGFIVNRLMYAMYREAFHLVENGYGSIEDIDRACKNVGGHWMTFCGLFRFMDLTGIQAYHTVMKDLFPDLSNQTTVPALIDDIVKNGGKGVFNGTGFYKYSPEEAKQWEDAFAKFAYDINRLSTKYHAHTTAIGNE